MKNVVIIACLLFGAFLVAVLCGADQAFAGRVGISAVFFFTALGHFAKPEEMMHMLPAGVPQQRLVILLSGIFELVLATAVLISACFRSAGLAICAFLVLATPLNIYSALHRVRRALLWALVSRDSSPTTGAPVRMDLLVHSPLNAKSSNQISSSNGNRRPYRLKIDTGAGTVKRIAILPLAS
jgi:uncharacterized membrane protein